MARSLATEWVRFPLTLRCTCLLGARIEELLRRYSSVSENESPVSDAVEPRIKKATGGKSIAEKLLAVVDKIHDRRLPPELRRGAGGSNHLLDPSRAEADIVNVAEHRIQRSILNGEFENLPGKGRPLKLEKNPHADPAEDMAYRILAKNGFAPEWVELNKEIRFSIERWRGALAVAYQKKMRRHGGGRESDTVMQEAWQASLARFQVELLDINRKVLKYNLLVPFGRQVMSYKLEKELIILQESVEKSERSTLQGS